MSPADWYIALFSLGSGVGIIAFWLTTFVRGKLDEVAGGRGDIGFHAVAELVTGAILVAGAVAIVADAAGRAAVMLSTFGLGLLVYSLIQSPGHYVMIKDRRMVATFIASGVLAIPAVIVRFVV
jgi:hypothetical protein